MLRDKFEDLKIDIVAKFGGFCSRALRMGKGNES